MFFVVFCLESQDYVLLKTSSVCKYSYAIVFAMNIFALHMFPMHMFALHTFAMHRFALHKKDRQKEPTIQ